MKLFGYTLAQLKKSIAAFLAPGVVGTIAAVTSGSPGGSGITRDEAIAIIASMVGTSILVFNLRNAPGGPPKPTGLAPPEGTTTPAE